MTDRISALTVVLDHDIREDDVQLIRGAIQMIRGVLSVDTHVRDLDLHIATERARREFENKLWEALKN